MKKLIAYGVIIVSLISISTARGASATLNLSDTTKGKIVAKNLSLAGDSYLRMQLAKDAINTDDMLLNFKSSATNAYDSNQDAPYFQGNGQVNLCSISSDNVNLAINSLPLPPKAVNIRLRITVKTDGSYKLNLTQLVNVPALFQIWLFDAYTRDSLDMRRTASYNLNVLKSDTDTYGSNRFSLVIRQNPALALQLLSFTASKADSGTNIAWTTANEQSYTSFTVERSADNGKTFYAIDSLASNSMGTYHAFDKKPSTGVNEYRLMLQDITGTVSYSDTVTLKYGNLNPALVNNKLCIYPNPAHNIVNMTIVPISIIMPGDPDIRQPTSNENAVYDIKIFNTSGVVIKATTTNQPTAQTDVSAFTPGTYIIRVVNITYNSVVGKGTFIKL